MSNNRWVERSQCAQKVVLVRPTGFGYDQGTAESNAFQRKLPDRDIALRAGEEFDKVLESLRRCGIGITVLEPVSADAPNAVYPNNWFSTHADGTVVIYPMLTPSRRAERDPHLAGTLQAEGYQAARVIDLTDWEQQGEVLEGTGSLVLDRLHGRAYACLSPRTTRHALDMWSARMGYGPLAFSATMDGTPGGQPVYHTNVVMSIGTSFAMVCLDALPHAAERARVLDGLAATGREVVPIALDQMHRFLGNVLELQGGGDRFILMSGSAHRALEPRQRAALERHARIVPVDIPTIETVGGGSIRCMLAENFLERS